MPTIDVDCAELERLLSVDLRGDMEKLDELLSLVKSEVKLYNEYEGVVSIEIKDTNRPDLWSVEGLARALLGFVNLEKELKQYDVVNPLVDVYVNSQLWNIRPYICCSVVKNVKLTDTIIRGLMHLQDKLDYTYGRSRQKTSIGIYDFDLITLPLNYTVTEPSAISFVPLGFEEKMNLAEILEQHPKGVEYGHIVKRHSVYPILLDSKRKVLSFPPIINSDDLGKISEETQNVLVEVTGTIHKTVLNTLNLVTLALIDRGGKAYSATVRYPEDSGYALKKVVTPDFSNTRMELNVGYVNKILGLQLTTELIANLLLKAGFRVEKVSGDNVVVLVPCYRVDVMHSVDLVEDIAIAYGYNNIEPLWRELPTTGGMRTVQRLIDVARESMVGLGFQEVLTYTLTSPESLFDKMNCEKTRIVEVANPKVVTMSCLRNWLLPSLMEFLGNNQSVEFPQKIFELGKVTLLDETGETKTRDEEWLAASITHPTASFSEIKSALDAFLMNFGVEWRIKENSHPSFIEGRVGAVIVNGVNVGVLGEVNPQVLEAWKLENPVAAFEVNMQRIIKDKLKP
ncbi:MAG: phenylalanine--tRNA ligase subunit beta [Candidatus Bathyarchaeota archaeon]|nr:MAG: phenylalanine--tRNA ligase subunit beta [Candidatus Bathyarchaeota archaeon]